MLDKKKNREFLKAIKENPNDLDLKKVYADFLEEQNEPLLAAQQRAKAGQGHIVYKVRRKSDGLFLNKKGYSKTVWDSEGISYKNKYTVNSFLKRNTTDHYFDRSNGEFKHTFARHKDCHGTPWQDVEIVAVFCTYQIVETTKPEFD